MSTRRNFLRTAAISALGISLSDHLAAQETRTPVKGFPLPDEPDYWLMVRRMFPMPADEVYLNTGTIGAQPNLVLESVINHMRQNAVNIARCDWKDGGIDLLSGYFPYNNLREKVGALINADYKEISLTQNATMGMNFLSAGLELEAGDEIVLTDKEHPGGKCGWELIAKRKNLNIKYVPIPTPANDPDKIVDLFKNKIGSKTRVISFPHVISAFGVILPAKKICELGQGKNIFTVVDGAQAIGHIPLDVKDIDCDAYYASPHKWLLAPAGNGILYIREGVVDKIWTTIASSQWDNFEDSGYRLTQRGTGNPAILAGLEAAIDFHNRIGKKRVTDRIKYLGDYLREGLLKINNIEIQSSTHPKMCSGITTFRLNGIDGQKLQEELWKRGKLQPRGGGINGIRVSTHIYTTKEEIDRFLKIVNELSKEI